MYLNVVDALQASMIDKLHSQGFIGSVGRVCQDICERDEDAQVISGESYVILAAPCRYCHIVPASGRLWFGSPKTNGPVAVATKTC